MQDTFLESVEILNTVINKSNQSKSILQLISTPELQTIVNFPVKMDNGEVKVFFGFRSRYSTLLGPAKGGIRFHPNVNPTLVNKLAFEMMIKCSIAGLPYGGGKGGVVVDPASLSEAELERVSRGYIKAIAHNIGANIDVPAPDVGTNGKIMQYMLNEYETVKNVKEPAVITGKPVDLGGSVFRIEATGYGVAYITNLFAKQHNLQPNATAVAIHGFGNLGSYAAQYLYNMGYKVVAISDMDGGVYNKNGLNVPEILKVYRNSSKGFVTLYSPEMASVIADCTKVTNEELLELDIDVLIPAAIDNVITQTNASNIKAKYIVEGANAPIDNTADEILNQAGKVIIPDVLANSGGVTVSYFEWYQNLHNEKWDEEKVKNALSQSLDKSFNAIYSKQQANQGFTLRESAFLVALDRLSAEIKNRYFT